MNKVIAGCLLPERVKIEILESCKGKKFIGMTYSNFRQHIIYIVGFYISRRSLEFDIFSSREDLKLW